MFLAAAIAAGISVFADGSLRAYACNVAPFSNGERVAFLGDSITHGGLYHANLQLFWDLRFPGSGTCMANCGISGDTAGGGAARYEHDVLPRQPDRVHPTPAGHIIMSALILEAMGVSPVVAKVEMDADGRVRRTVRAEVSGVKASPRGVSFRYAPASLPFPTPEEYREADAVYPVSKKMNMEILEIAELPSGEYDLLADGKAVGTFSADLFAAGVNLALLPTPEATLAMEAWKISREISSLQLRLRSLAMVEKVAAGHGAKADDFEDVCAKMEEFVRKLEKDGNKYADYYSRQLTAYRRDKAQTEQLRAKEDDCRRKLAAAASKKAAYTIAIRPSARQ